MVLIKLFGNLRLMGVGGRVELALADSGATVADALRVLFDQAPQLRDEILDPATGETLPFVNIMLKGRLIRDLQGLQTPVAPDDTLAIFPPAAGG